MRQKGISVLIGIVAGLACWQYQVVFGREAGDFSWPLCGARALLAGQDPYQACVAYLSSGDIGPTNPLPTILVLLPFVWLPDELIAGGILGMSSGLLAWLLCRDGTLWRLLLFGAAPFWWCVQMAQWPVLLLCVALLPQLYPLVIVKPQMGLPIALMHMSWRRVIITSMIVVFTLVIDPDWPVQWLRQVAVYDGFVPLFVLPGPLVLLALVRWREERARWLLLYSLMPQRIYYDQIMLFLIPRTIRQMLLLVVVSWLAYFGWYFIPSGGLLWFMTLYLVCLLLVLVRENQVYTD